MALTAEQLSYLRNEFGGVSETVFPDTELNEIWDALSGASSDNQRREATLGLMARRLLISSAKLHDYAAGQSEEKLEQVYKHLEKVYELFRPAVEAALNTRQQLVIGALREIPTQPRDKPGDFSSPTLGREWPNA